MDAIQSPLAFKVIGFDTMGTLLDERRGINIAFEPTAKQLQQPIEAADLHRRFDEVNERRVRESNPGESTYRSILAESHKEVTLDLSKGAYKPSREESLAFADGLKHWPAFPDTVAAMKVLAQNSKLVLLSNMDTETLAYIAEHGALKGVPIAGLIGSDRSKGFKPDHKVNKALLDFAQNEYAVPKAKVLLIAQGLTSDHVPAREMDLSSAWIDRYDGGESAIKEAGVKPRWVFSSLSDLVKS